MITPATAPSVDQLIVTALIDEDLQAFQTLASRGVEREAITARARVLGLTDRMIKECRTSGSRPTMRLCVACDASFLSFGSHNRLCRRCPKR